MLILRRALLIALVVLLAGRSAFALDTGQTLKQVSHTAWLTQDGVFGGTPQAISQGADGYLWIGTSAGVDLFDGVRFVRWNPPGGADANTESVNEIVRARDGGMWLATDRRLLHWKDGVLTPYRPDHTNAVVEDAHGAIYHTRSRIADKGGPLCQVRGTETRCFDAKAGVPFAYAERLLADRVGNLWVASSKGLLRWKDGSGEVFTPPGANLKDAAGTEGISALAERPAGGLWVGLRAGSGAGLQQLVNGTWETVTLPGLDGSKLNVSALFLDREDSLWVGTLDSGIFRIAGTRADHFSRADGLSSDGINYIFEDREKNIWVATSKGIDRFRNLRVTSFSLSEGLDADLAASVLPANEGDVVWVGNALGVDSITAKPGIVHIGKVESAIKRARITALMQDREGRLWFGAGSELWIRSTAGVKAVTKPGGRPLGVITTVAQAADGDVWASSTPGTSATLYRIHNDTVVEAFPNAQIPWAFHIIPDPRDGIWLAFRNGSLGRIREGHFQSYEVKALYRQVPLSFLSFDYSGNLGIATPIGFVEWSDNASRLLSKANGLPCDDVHSFQFDIAGNVWLYTKCGILEVKREDLANWRENPAAIVSARHWDVLDGADPSSVPFQPSSGRSQDGRIWFVNGRVVQMIDPRHLIENEEPPLVHIEGLYVDRRPYPVGGEAKLSPHTRDIEIDFTAPTFVIPSKVRFKYKLDGYDEEWSDPSPRRNAFYTNLPPGRYRFQVVAANEDGIWNNTGASISFAIARAWYQMSWFIVISLLSLIILIALLYRFRMHQVRNGLMTRFNDRLLERTRLAQELHDTLIQTIQGSKLVAADALDNPDDVGHMRTAMEKLSGWLSQAIEEGRMALNSLRSGTTETGELIRELVREIEHCKACHSLDIELSFPDSSREIVPTVYTEASRIAGEAIRNASSHSMGSKVTVALTTVEGLGVRIGDDGVGIQEDVLESGKKGHYGLQGMRERAQRIGARFSIHRSANGGTQVELFVPEEIAFADPGRRIGKWRRLRR